MDHKPELLPCPYCGGQAKVSSFPGAHNVWCENQPVKCGNRAMFTVDQWNTRAAPAEDVSALGNGQALPELTSDLRGILGRPNFTCNGIAQALRQMGFEIPKKSEEEQAATIYWMLGHYLRDPVNWRDAASAELKAGASAPHAQQ